MNNSKFPWPRLETLLGTVFVNNTMVSHIWIVALFIIAVLFLAWMQAEAWIIAIVLLFLFLLLIFYFFTYLHFMKNNPHLLLSEKSFLSTYRMQVYGTKKKEKSFDVIEGEELMEKTKLLTTSKPKGGSHE